jgi:hypothetical protein
MTKVFKRTAEQIDQPVVVSVKGLPTRRIIAELRVLTPEALLAISGASRAGVTAEQSACPTHGHAFAGAIGRETLRVEAGRRLLERTTDGLKHV